MSNQEMIDAYDQAFRSYEAAKAGKGNRVKAFAQFMSAETALVNHFRPEGLQRYNDRSPLSIPQRMNGGIRASVTVRAVKGRAATAATG